jgi:hypothetical protein
VAPRAAAVPALAAWVAQAALVVRVQAAASAARAPETGERPV